MNKSNTRFRTTPHNRRGAILPLIAILMPVLVLFVGFSVDLAYMQNTRLELRAATDNAARAAATRLSLTDDQNLARQAGMDIAGMNTVAGEPLQLDSADFVFGKSSPDSSGKWVFQAGGTPTNAVRIAGRRTAGSPSGAVPLFFGSFLGRTTFEPIQSATAAFIHVDICLVLDRSTSMKLNADSSESGMYVSDSRFCRPPNSSSRWASLDEAIQVFVAELERTQADEQVALATYSSAFVPAYYCGTTSVAATLDSKLDSNLKRVENAMSRLATTVWNGNTNIEAGMRVGLDELTNSPKVRSSATKVMIVLTDGYENVGDALEAAQDCAAAGITLHTITFGDFANQARMATVASTGGGRHIHASDEAALKAAFKELAAQVSQLTE